MVVPKIYRKLILEQLHNNMGHQGVERGSTPGTRFFWPHMYRNIERYVTSECSCLKAKAPPLRARAPLVPIHTTAPMELVSLTSFIWNAGKVDLSIYWW